MIQVKGQYIVPIIKGIAIGCMISTLGSAAITVQADMPGRDMSMSEQAWMEQVHPIADGVATVDKQVVTDLMKYGSTVIVQDNGRANYRVNIPRIANFIALHAVDPREEGVFVKTEVGSYYVGATNMDTYKAHNAYMNQPYGHITETMAQNIAKEAISHYTGAVYGGGGLLTKSNVAYPTWDYGSYPNINEAIPDALSTYTANFYFPQDTHTFYNVSNSVNYNVHDPNAIVANYDFANFVIPSMRRATIDSKLVHNYTSLVDATITAKIPAYLDYVDTQTDVVNNQEVTVHTYMDRERNQFQIIDVAPSTVIEDPHTASTPYRELMRGVNSLVYNGASIDSASLVLANEAMGVFFAGTQYGKHYMYYWIYPEHTNRMVGITFVYDTLPKHMSKQMMTDIIQSILYTSGQERNNHVYASIEPLRQD